MEAAPLLVFVALGAVAWRCAAFVLGLLAWLALVPIALSVLVGVPVPRGAVVLTVLLYAGSHLASRIRKGRWRWER